MRETYEEVPEPICADTDCGAFGTDVQWEDLWYIDPWNAVHSCAEREHILSVYVSQSVQCV